MWRKTRDIHQANRQLIELTNTVCNAKIHKVTLQKSASNKLQLVLSIDEIADNKNNTSSETINNANNINNADYESNQTDSTDLMLRKEITVNDVSQITECLNIIQQYNSFYPNDMAVITDRFHITLETLKEPATQTNVKHTVNLLMSQIGADNHESLLNSLMAIIRPESACNKAQAMLPQASSSHETHSPGLANYASLDEMIEKLGEFETMYQLAKTKNKNALAMVLGRGHSISTLHNKETILIRLARENNQDAVEFLMQEFSFSINSERNDAIFYKKLVASYYDPALFQALLGYAIGGHVDQVSLLIGRYHANSKASLYQVAIMGYIVGQHYEHLAAILKKSITKLETNNTNFAEIIFQLHKTNYLPANMTIKQWLASLARLHPDILNQNIIPYKNNIHRAQRNGRILNIEIYRGIIKQTPFYADTYQPSIDVWQESLEIADIEDLLDLFAEKNITDLMQKHNLNRMQILAWISLSEINPFTLLNTTGLAQTNSMNIEATRAEQMKHFLEFGLQAEEAHALYEKMTLHAAKQYLIDDLNELKKSGKDKTNSAKIDSLIACCETLDLNKKNFKNLLKQQISYIQPKSQFSLPSSSASSANKGKTTLFSASSASSANKGKTTISPPANSSAFFNKQPASITSESTALLVKKNEEAQYKSAMFNKAQTSNIAAKNGPYYCMVEDHLYKLKRKMSK